MVFMQNRYVFIPRDRFMDIVNHFTVNEEYVGSEHKFKLLFSPSKLTRGSSWFIAQFATDEDLLKFRLMVADFIEQYVSK